MTDPADRSERLVRADPDAVPTELVELTRRIGDPARDLVVLAEGNTSTVTVDGRFVVKASGARMDGAMAGDFVVVESAPLLRLVERAGTTQDDLSEALATGTGRQASIETLVHVAAIEAGGAFWVAHTHPTAVVGTLAVKAAEELWSAPLFPDEAVVVGRPAWVPYVEPGLLLGRAVLDAVRRYADTEGRAPRLVLLGNHGIVALGRSADEVEAITTMAVKAARVRLLAGGLAGPEGLLPLDTTAADRLADRPDEVARRGLLGGARP
jgi:rhamnose utilization protein RhaD (predicted bifunctional aldolase and dehydrogenase)